MRLSRAFQLLCRSPAGQRVHGARWLIVGVPGRLVPGLWIHWPSPMFAGGWNGLIKGGTTIYY